MRSITNYYGFQKPDANDFYDIQIHNDNMDAIDTALKEADGSFAAEKVTLVDADTILLKDSADSKKLKRITWANLKTAFENVFAAKSHASAHKTGGSDALNPSDIGAVPTSRTVNGKALDVNITLEPKDIGLGNVSNVAPDDQIITFTRATGLENLRSGKTLSHLFGQLDRLMNSYINHTLLENPHGITAEDIGALSANDPEALANVIETLFEDGSVNTLRSAIDVTSATLTGNVTQTFTGTGKGKLFLSAGQTLAPTVVIDGVTMTDVSIPVNKTIEIEFLKSFSVTNTNTANYVYVNAVFY